MAIKTGEKIITTRLEYKNLGGRKIVACLDHSNSGYRKKPFLIIPPAYGETKKNSIHLGYYLAQNGFNVLRYDGTNHIGESDGEILNHTLHDAKNDLIATMDFLGKEFNAMQFGIVATSLAVRVAIKTASLDKRINFIVSIAGIVDFSYTIWAVYNEDIIGNYLNNSAKEKYEILGYEVDSYFLEVAVNAQYHNLDTTIKDINNINTPVVFICPQEDEWNKAEDIDKIVKMFPTKNITKIIVPKGMHQIYENANAAKMAIYETINKCMGFAYNTPLNLLQILEPNIDDVIEQNKLEKEWLKKYKLTEEEEKQFWNIYMNQYGTLIKSNDYLQFLGLISDLLGEIHEGNIILDTGCGNGHFGLYLIHSMVQRYQKQDTTPLPPQGIPMSIGVREGKNELVPPSYIYIGVDFVEGPIKDALVKHFGAKVNKFDLNKFQKFFYILQDINTAKDDYFGPLSMFSNDFFDKICCSLLLSYVQEPTRVLKELFRVLKPKGKIVVTSMKPYCDLSKIYRNYLQQVRDYKEIEDARLLLNSAGKIKEQENIGFYKFFPEEKLVDMLVDVGLTNIKIYRSFGNQANVAIAEKGLYI